MASFWNALTGKSSSSSQQEKPFTTPTSDFTQPPPLDPTTTDVNSFLLNSPFDASALHPLSGLADQDTLDYILLDESIPNDLPGSRSALPSRGWSDDLCYGTGTTYLLALTTGGAWGAIEGLRKSPPNAPPKLKLNSVLNAVTRRGPFMGNNAGVIALAYNIINSGIGAIRGKHDAANSVLAGALAGAVWKSTRGPRAMAIAGGLSGLAAGAWAVGRRALA
ncbi:Tim17/Tim22/Tim23/Pmp24 family-domain-containing protein [Peziza echinospora]|nr:Tim17/Tim22/Tim23/Pmp24 family-domain-containing protein [Peziza echinospora]